MAATIHVIGMGGDGPSPLPEVKQVLAQAQILCGAERHLAHFPEHPARRLVWGHLDLDIAAIKDSIAQGYEHLVVLASGDPLFFGIGRLLLCHFPADMLRFYPHLSAVQLAFSRLKLPWQDARVISLHGRACENLLQPLKQGVEKIAIFTDPQHSVAEIAQVLQGLALPVHYRIWVCENLGSPQENVQCLDIETARHYQTPGLNVVVLVRESVSPVLPPSLPLVGLADHWFESFPDQPGLMTKKEIRVLVLSLLHLQDGQVIWDVGAGTGSVSIEIARLLPHSTIYAIEKNSLGVQLIRRNLARFQVNNVAVMSGAAPQALATLPNPQRVFIGGSSGELLVLLDAVAARLSPGGVVVLALATQEHLAQTLQWSQQQSWQYQALDVRLARSLAIGELTRWQPLNPVTLVQLTKPA
ncbi:MAG: precorrin-6y C5,15-methyltransferase (decarboxylating) subunit CbiE [Gloeomargarita sp. SKYG116]|nr:precorrin-6y C5,15-methyltransferase (decarboxylating) subunit CbiE [Gloeomargarita sp. SKYG116]MDW8402281.1 precorrin-6y C5,15-methyltransferase (decarboxylating) subunit CbiE [Gloeomargarita sp. SKYGB_i_bin116]